MKQKTNQIRSFLAFVLIACLILAGCTIERKKSSMEYASNTNSSWPVKIVVATDLHYISPKLTDNKEYFMKLVYNGDGKASQYCEEIVDGFIDQMLEEKPQVIILSGDLTFNGEKQSHLDLAKKLEVLKEAGIRVLALPGNHDLYNTKAAAFQNNSYKLVETISAKDFEKIYQNLGYQNALEKDPDSLSYIVQIQPGLRVLLVDVNTKEAGGILTDQTLAWIEKQLEAAKKDQAKVLAISHQNLIAHNVMFTKGFVMENNVKLLKLYEAHDVLCNLSGHMHIQHIQESENGFVEIATSSLAVCPFQYGIMQIDQNGFNYQTKSVEFAHQKEGEKLFWDTSYYKMGKGLKEIDEKLPSYFSRLNQAYFSGRMDLLKEDEQIYKELAKNSAFGPYIDSILKDDFEDQTKFEKHTAWKAKPKLEKPVQPSTGKA